MPATSARHFDENRSVWLADKTAYHRSSRARLQPSRPTSSSSGAASPVFRPRTISRNAFPRKASFSSRRGRSRTARAGATAARCSTGSMDSTRGLRRKRSESTTPPAEGIESVLEIVAEHGLRVPFRREGHLDVFTSARAADQVRRALEEIEGSGVPLRFLSKREISTRGSTSTESKARSSTREAARSTAWPTCGLFGRSSRRVELRSSKAPPRSESVRGGRSKWRRREEPSGRRRRSSRPTPTLPTSDTSDPASFRSSRT